MKATTLMLSLLFAVAGVVRAVSVNDAFKRDWVKYHTGPVSKQALLDEKTVLQLSTKNILYYTDLITGKVLNYIDLALHKSDDFIVGDTTIATYSKGGMQVAIFEKSTGIFLAHIPLNAPPEQLQPYGKMGWTILQQDKIPGRSIGESVGELITWSGENVHVFGEFASRTFLQYPLPKKTLIVIDSNVFELATSENGDFQVSETNDFGQLYDTLFPVEVIENIKLGDGNKSPMYISDDTAVIYFRTFFAIYRTVDGKGSVLFKKTFDNIADVQISGSFISVITEKSAHLLDTSKLLQGKGEHQVSHKAIKLHSDLVDTVLTQDAFTALNGKEGKFYVHSYNTKTETSTTSVFPAVPFAPTKSIVVDFPPSLAKIEEAHHLEEDARASSLVFRWFLRTKTHLTQLGRAIHKVVLRKSAKSLAEEDVFGFNKILLQIDEDSSPVVAKSTNNGALLWTHELAGHREKVLDLKASGSQVFVIYEAAAEILDLRTGEKVRSAKYGSPIEKVVSLRTASSPVEDVSEAIALKIGNALEFLTGEDNVEESQFLFHQNGDVIEFFKVHGKILVPTWQWGAPDQRILAVSKNSDALTGAGGIARHDRSVLYKYLNPNLITIVSEKNGVVAVSLVDGVSGDLVHTQEHRNETIDLSSVRVAQNDNWIVYSFFVTAPVSEQRIAVIDLFQAEKDVSAAQKSAFSSANVTVSSKAFMYSERILALKSTTTKFGVTIRSVIALTESGGVVEIPKYVLNSRRIDGRAMTQKDQMDDYHMMPYAPVVPENTFSTLNHKNRLQVTGEKPSLLVLQTNLESTAVVCVVNGMNEFCTVVQPSSSYDLLKSDFDKKMLLVTIAVLLGGYILSKPFVEAKKLNAKWVD